MAQKPKKPPVTPKTLLQKIPLAGMENLLMATGKYERPFWVITLLLGTALTLFHTIPVILSFITKQRVVNLKSHTQKELPFPFVYVCMNGAINYTYFKSMLNDPALTEISVRGFAGHVCRKYAVCGQKWVGNLMNFLAYSPTQEPNFDTRLVPAFKWQIATAAEYLGDKWPGYQAFYDLGFFKCENVLTNCAFNGQPFECCPKGQNMIANLKDDICFGMNPTGTFLGEAYQSKIGWKAGLTFETNLNSADMSDATFETAGIRVHFGRHISMHDAPITIPTDSIGYFKVQLNHRIAQKNCIHQFRYDPKNHINLHEDLQNYIKEMEKPSEYDSHKCETMEFLKAFSTTCGCVVRWDRTLRPNDSSICTPGHLFACFYRGFMGSIQFSQSGSKSGSGDIVKYAKHKSDEDQCLPLCDTWRYQVQSTFVQMVKSNDTTRANGSPIFRNKVIINFADDEYQVIEDILKMDWLSFTGDLGLGLGSTLGVSAVSIIHIFVYGIAAILLKRKLRRVEPVTPPTAGQRK